MRTRRAVVTAALAAIILSALTLLPRPTPQPAVVESFAPPLKVDSLALLAKHYPAAKTNAREEVTIIRTADGFEPRFGGKLEPQINIPGSRWKNPAKAVLPKFPKQFNNPMSVSSTFDAPCSTGVPPVSSSAGRSPASSPITYAASAVPLNGNAKSAGEIAADGTLLYKNAFGEGIDVIYRVQALKTEEFIVIHERATGGLPSSASGGTPAKNQSRARQQAGATDTRQFSWDLNLGHGESALKPRLTAMHTIELCDQKGVPRLRIDLPEGKDAEGKRLAAGKELRYTLEGNRVTLVANLKAAKFPVIIDPTFASTGMMAVARGQHSATLLPGNKVLVAGGSGNLFSCEIFDAATQTWRATGSMNVGRWDYPTVTLADGRLLAISGSSSGGSTALCEIFDPATESWTTTGAVTHSRAFHAGVVLADGTVLACGNVPFSERFDPSTGLWSATGALSVGPSYSTAEKLGNGDVIHVGGTNGGVSSYSVCEMYNSANGTWASTSSLFEGRSSHTSTLLQNGNVFVTGGSTGTALLKSCESFDPSTSNWTQKASMLVARYFHRATLLDDGSILVTGGTDFNDPLSSAEIYNPASNAWAKIFDLLEPRNGHSATKLADGRVLVSGGYGLSSCELFVPDNFVLPTELTARITTSDIVAFIGLPFTFDASFSTDPKNSIIGYLWDFGDSSPSSGEKTISKIYTSAGSYSVTLIVRNSDGLTNTVTRIIEVLPADQAGLFNGFVTYKARWDRDKESKDTLQLTAQVNVGEQVVGAGTVVALDIVGQHFEGTLDLKLRDKTDPNDVWQVKANLRKQPFGTVQLKAKIKNADLGLGFNQAGAVKGADPSDIVDADIPVRITIGGRSFELNVASEFKFNSSGKRAKGEGDE